MNYRIHFFLLILLGIGCKVEDADPKVSYSQSAMSAAPISSSETDAALNKYFSPPETAAILDIKEVFDKGLKENSKDRAISYYYEDHAQRMRLDYFNKFPYTLNYPYNDKFDLRDVATEVPQLSFLTNKCGFQNGDQEVVNYYCFKKEGRFMEFLQQLGKETPFIAVLHEDYIKQMTITQQIRQHLILDSQERLDFQQVEHQVVYMFYQILINEERLATNRI